MAQATFVHQGDCIDHTPAGDLATGEVVVQGDLVGIARTALAAGTLGSLAVAGVFDFAKAGGVAFTVGQVLYWDDAANVVTTTSAGNKQLGKVVRAAASADVSVRLRLSQ